MKRIAVVLALIILFCPAVVMAQCESPDGKTYTMPGLEITFQADPFGPGETGAVRIGDLKCDYVIGPKKCLIHVFCPNSDPWYLFQIGDTMLVLEHMPLTQR